MTKEEVANLTNDELFDIIQTSNDLDLIQLCVEEDTKRKGIKLKQMLEAEAQGGLYES